MGHEVSHVANGDMVTLTLDPGGGECTFVIVLSHRWCRRSVDRGRGGGYSRGYGVSGDPICSTQTVLGFLATIIVRWFSRWREFRADTAVLNLAGREKMIAALERLQRGVRHRPGFPTQMQAFGINGGLLRNSAGLKTLYS